MILASGVRKLTNGQLNLAFSICGSETTPLTESMQRLQSSADGNSVDSACSPPQSTPSGTVQSL